MPDAPASRRRSSATSQARAYHGQALAMFRDIGPSPEEERACKD
jgi:hypothetical protein